MLLSFNEVLKAFFSYERFENLREPIYYSNWILAADRTYKDCRIIFGSTNCRPISDAPRNLWPSRIGDTPDCHMSVSNSPIAFFRSYERVFQVHAVIHQFCYVYSLRYDTRYDSLSWQIAIDKYICLLVLGYYPVVLHSLF